MSTVTHPLPPLVAELFDRVTLGPGLMSARVDERTVNTDTPYDLRKQLSGAIYDVLHAGLGSDDASLPYHTRDEDFERLLAEAVPHSWAEERLRLVEAGEDTAIVLRDGLRVRVPLDRVRTRPPLAAGREVRVRVRPDRPLLSPGFFFLNGTRGAISNGSILRVYAHLEDPGQAPAVWHRLALFLEEAGACYRTKILSTPLLYPRRDALVIYLEGGSAKEHLDGLTAHLANAPGLGESTPAFAERLAPGLSIAWEPNDRRKEFQGLSFGQHRAYLITDSLLESAEKGLPLEEVAERKFAEANVDYQKPSRNIDSPF